MNCIKSAKIIKFFNFIFVLKIIEPMIKDNQFNVLKNCLYSELKTQPNGTKRAEKLKDYRILNYRIFKLFNFYFTPVLPNPPSPLKVSESSSTSIHSALSCLAIINCAILSPFSITKTSFDKFTKITPISPL